MTNTLSLATRLRELDDESLRRLIATRGVRVRSVQDLFDLAEALLEHDSLQRALAMLDRFTLAVLASTSEPRTGSQVVDALVALGAPPPNVDAVERVLRAAAGLMLVEFDGESATCYAAVTEQLASWPQRGLPGTAALAAAAAPHPSAAAGNRSPEDPIRHAADAAAAEQAFASTTCVAELITALSLEPAQELQKGGLALPATRRLAAAMAVDAEEVPGFLSVAARSGLVVCQARQWLVTEESAQWLPLPTAERWRIAADAWLTTLPAQLRTLLGSRIHTDWGADLQAAFDWTYPAADERLRTALREAVRDATALGLRVAQVPTSAAALLLERGATAAAEAMRPLLPTEVDKVYVQQDLSIIAPGPLQPAVDARLRSFADVQGRTIASSYRVSEATVNRAVASGARAADLLDFLAEISLSGIPQPLEYLITETAERFGRVRAGTLTHDESINGMSTRPRSYLRSHDATLMRTLEVDQSLAALGLRRDGSGRLLSRFDRDDVFWALVDQRYPVAAEELDGSTVALRRSRVAAATAPEEDRAGNALIARLREADRSAGPDAEQAWLSRQLELAVRGRLQVRIRVRMPDDHEVEYTLEVTGVGGGRVRGRDHASDIERTLPLANITGVTPLPSSTRA